MLKLATKFAPHPDELEKAYRAGFRFAELWLDAAVLASWRTVLQNTLHYPNGYALHFPNHLDVSSETLEQTVALYRRLDCSCLVIHQPMADKFREPLLRLDPEIRLGVENHQLTPQGFEDWAGKNSGLTLDVEHLWKYTLRDVPLERLLEEVRAFLARHGDKLLHVHLPGYWPGFEEHRPMYCARAMIFPVLLLLAEFRFEGLIVSEANLEFQNPLELRMDVLLFDAWREQHERPTTPGNRSAHRGG
jgi:hypothetical protein